MAINDPITLDQALGTFDDVWSPRIVATMNDYDVRIAHTLGEHVWHGHDDTDEFFLVSTTGDGPDNEIPDHVDSTTGHQL